MHREIYNAGNHGKRIVTLFGELPEILRTHFWNEDSRKGHYPFDDRLGLTGRYTPAAANEMIRYAVDHPYKDAAEVFSRNHAFKVSADMIREIVGLHRDKSSAFVKGAGTGERAEADARAEVVCVMGDGTGMPMRRECLQGAKVLLPLRALHKSSRLEEFFQHLVKDLWQVDCAA